MNPQERIIQWMVKKKIRKELYKFCIFAYYGFIALMVFIIMFGLLIYGGFYNCINSGGVYRKGFCMLPNCEQIIEKARLPFQSEGLYYNIDDPNGLVYVRNASGDMVPIMNMSDLQTKNKWR